MSRRPPRPGEIRTYVPKVEGGPERPCVWCSQPTDILALTPYRTDLGRVPLHLFCAAELTQIKAKMDREGTVALPSETIRRLEQFAKNLLMLPEHPAARA